MAISSVVPGRPSGIRATVDSFLADLGRERREVGSWVLHTGGPKVLQATAAALGLENGQQIGVVGLLAARGQSFVGVGAGGARRSNEEPAAGAGDTGIAGGDGAGILLRTGGAGMVMAGSGTEDRVLVIGGGPAGLAVALAARQRGFDVTVADSCAPPIDKPCGEGLMPDGIAALDRLGVTIPATDAYAFHGLRFVSGGLVAEAIFPRGFALGVRRPNLHCVMVEQAERAGVQFWWRAVVTGLQPEGALLQGDLVRARWIVGADGSSSLVRRWAGLDSHLRRKERFAFRRHYNVAPWSGFMELHWAASCQLYVTPVAPEQVCVALISRDPSLRLDEALHEFPEVAERLRGAAHGSGERGAVSVTRTLARVCKGRVALIGDASGGVDAITGEGLCLAFQQANLLADCLLSGDLNAYQSGHWSLARRPALMADLMLVLAQRAGLRQRVMRAFLAEPGLFARMLATHVGAVSPMDLASNGVALSWGLLTA